MSIRWTLVSTKGRWSQDEFGDSHHLSGNAKRVEQDEVESYFGRIGLEMMPPMDPGNECSDMSRWSECKIIGAALRQGF